MTHNLQHYGKNRWRSVQKVYESKKFIDPSNIPLQTQTYQMNPAFLVQNNSLSHLNKVL